VEDIQKILGTESEYLIRKEMEGCIVDGIYYRKDGIKNEKNIGCGIRRTIELRKEAERKMKYPEVVLPCYETIQSLANK
jgi:hypothetical protein